MANRFFLATGCGLLLCVLGCPGDDSEADTAAGSEGADSSGGATSNSGSGETGPACLEQDPAYVAGPYGAEVGSTIESIALVGFAQPDMSTDQLEPIAIGDFYNPTADGVFPTGSPHGECTPKPRALLFVLTSAWSQPALDLMDVLVDEHADYETRGAQFLFALVQDENAQPATEPFLQGWVDQYQPAFPHMLDPQAAVHTASGLEPTTDELTSFVIDTSDMSIAAIVEETDMGNVLAFVDSVLGD